MDKNEITHALQELRKNATKRKFDQTIDLIINLKNLDLKQPDQQVDVYVQLPKPRGRKIKVGAFAGPEMHENAKNSVDTVILHDHFPQYAADKKKVKKLAETHDFFIAQANIMPDVAKTFGRVLGTRGKMPNPKAGCVVPPNANLKAVAEKLKNTVRCSARTQLSIKIPIAKESQADADIVENVHTIIEQVLHALPQEMNNVSSAMLKLTMGKPIKIGSEQK